MPRCIICRRETVPGVRVLGGVPDFPGDTASSRGQTLTAVPVIGQGPFCHCPYCGVTYRMGHE